jgi:hypothetical protein
MYYRLLPNMLGGAGERTQMYLVSLLNYGTEMLQVMAFQQLEPDLGTEGEEKEHLVAKLGAEKESMFSTFA